MKRRSKKRAVQESQYFNKDRKEFMEGNPYCAIKIPGICQVIATTVHHKKGRQGYADQWARDNGINLLNDIRFFLPGCWPCHQYVELHPTEAKEKGWSISRLAK